MDSIEKKQRIELLRDGDGEAWDDVVSEYQKPLSQYLHNMVRDKELAQDLTQDTFIEAYQAIPKTQGNLNLKSWLYRIATNNAIQVLRRRRIISWIPWVEGIRTSTETSSSHEENLAQSELVHNTMKKLPEKYRAVLLLHDGDGFNCTEIGTLLNISLEATQKRLTRARVMFRDAYEKLEKI